MIHKGIYSIRPFARIPDIWVALMLDTRSSWMEQNTEMIYDAR